MPLTLCQNCRLPVQENAARCPQCGVERGQPVAQRSVPIAAALAFVATLAFFARRLA